MNENQDLVTPEDKLKLLFEHRPWESEPDEADWDDAKTGYKCRIKRNDSTGTLCGYVGVPRGHRLYGMTYQRLEAELEADSMIPVHGGLTFSGAMGEGDVYHFFGFDTAHAGDLCPAAVLVTLKYVENAKGFHEGDTYRTWEYVKNNVQVLALQLKLYNKGKP